MAAAARRLARWPAVRWARRLRRLLRDPASWIPAEAQVTFRLTAPVTVNPVNQQEAARLAQGLYPGGPTLYHRGTIGVLAIRIRLRIRLLRSGVLPAVLLQRAGTTTGGNELKGESR